MKLNIPEIGTDLNLIKDWNLKLYPESRNQKLAEFFGYLQNSFFFKDEWKKFWCDEKVLENKNNLFSQIRPMPSQYVNLENQYNKILSEDYKKWELERYCILQKFLEENTIHEILELKIPEGSILKVDRIYIRKGASDFSSVSFWLKLPDVKKKIRFWAKLENVNEIEFEGK